jgi:hypothetical protein
LEFLKAVDPTIALLSTGPAEFTGIVLPDVEVLDAIKGLKPGMKLLRTDEHDSECPVADRIGIDTGTGGCDNHILEIGR